MAAMRCLVSGRVQGVFFRDSTRQEALRLGLYGSAVNLPDGRVEVIASGESEALAALRAWLRHGPPLAHVDHLDCAALDSVDCGQSFTIA